MAIFNNQDPQRESNVGQFGATDESIGAYKQAAEYAKDAEYWAKLSQQGIENINDLLVVVQDLYEKGELQLEEIQQLKRDFAAQDARLIQLIAQTNGVITDANNTIDKMDDKLAEVQAQLDILLAMDVSVTTLPPGTDATGNYNPQTGLISLGIPEGQPGKDGTVTDLATAPMGVPDSADFGFYVESTNSKVYRAKMSDIAKTFPAVVSVSYNGGNQKEVGDVNITKAKLGLGNVLDVPSYSKTETDSLNVPYPDVWAPLNDDMRLLAGVAPYDTLSISGQILELATKSMNFSRSTTATYIDKTGVLRTASVNEPRFEREGLLMENQGTNYFLNSDDPTKWAGRAASITPTSVVDGATQAVTMKAVCNNAVTNLLAVQSSAVTLVDGEAFTLSARFRGTYGKFRFRVVKDSGFFGDVVFMFSTGQQVINPPTGMTATAESGDDGYTYATFTLNSATAGVYVGQIYIMPDDADTNIPVNSEFYIQTIQFEKSAIATSYIPTGASTVTRTGDNWSLPAENAGYRTLATKFKRTLAFEFVVKGLGPSASSYVDVFRVTPITNDIVCRISASNRLTSYRDGGGIFVPYVPDQSGVYVHQINGDSYTTYFNGNTGTRTSAPGNTTSIATNISNSTGPSGTSFVYHIRNLRIWHKILTADQIRGIR